MKKFPNGAVNLILAAATVAPSFATASTFAQTPVDDLPALALPDALETDALATETLVADDGSTVVATEYADAAITPDEALRQLVAGNARYLRAASDAANALPRLSTADDRFPIATILYASDMPVKPDALTQTTDRDVYLAPVLAGAVSSDDLAAVEYGVLNLQTPLLVVVGHYPSRDVSNLVRNFDALERRAQAEAATVSADQRLATAASVPDDLKTYNLVGPAVARAREAYPDLEGYDLANVVSEAIVWQSLETILLKSAVVQDLVRAGRLDVVAALADDKTGRLYWLGQHPLQEEFVKPLPEEYVLDETADAVDGAAILTDADLPAPLDADAIQVYVERYENNAYYADYVDEYYRVPVYYEPSWELFAARAWTYRPWNGVWVDSFVPWPHYHPWGPPPGVAPGFGFSLVDGRLSFFIGVNRRPDGPRYVDPRFRPQDAWWGADAFLDPRRLSRDPIFELIFSGRRHDLQPLPFDRRPGYRPGPPRPQPQPRPNEPARPAWRPGALPPATGIPFPGYRPGGVRPGYRPGAPAPGIAPPGYRPGAPGPGIDPPGYRPNERPGNRPGTERPNERPGNRPGTERPNERPGNRPGFERPTVRPGGLTPLPGDRLGGDRSPVRPGGLTPIPATRPGGDRPGFGGRPGNRPGATRPGGGNRSEAERPGNRIGAERPQIAARPAAGNRIGAERPQIAARPAAGNRTGVERPQIAERPAAGNRTGAERPQIAARPAAGNRIGAERPQIAERPAAGNRIGAERPGRGGRP